MANFDFAKIAFAALDLFRIFRFSRSELPGSNSLKNEDVS
jgi:hypothetical protein